MKKIYILLMHTNTIPSRVVKFFTRYKYSHVAISFTKDCNDIYSFGRKKVNRPLKGGFIKEKKNGDFFTKFNRTDCKIFELEVTDVQFNDAKQIINNMEINIKNYKYDFIGVALRFFKIPITFKNKYVCSYFVAYVLSKSKIYNFKNKDYFVVPKNFEKIENLKLIYQGNFNEYK